MKDTWMTKAPKVFVFVPPRFTCNDPNAAPPPSSTWCGNAGKEQRRNDQPSSRWTLIFWKRSEASRSSSPNPLKSNRPHCTSETERKEKLWVWNNGQTPTDCTRTVQGYAVAWTQVAGLKRLGLCFWNRTRSDCTVHHNHPKLPEHLHSTHCFHRNDVAAHLCLVSWNECHGYAMYWSVSKQVLFEKQIS